MAVSFSHRDTAGFGVAFLVWGLCALRRSAFQAVRLVATGYISRRLSDSFSPATPCNCLVLFIAQLDGKAESGLQAFREEDGVGYISRAWPRRERACPRRERHVSRCWPSSPEEAARSSRATLHVHKSERAAVTIRPDGLLVHAARHEPDCPDCPDRPWS